MNAILNRTQVTNARQRLRESGISEGHLCCRGIALELGDAEQKWYGLFPPDRMHCWYTTNIYKCRDLEKGGSEVDVFVYEYRPLTIC